MTWELPEGLHLVSVETLNPCRWALVRRADQESSCIAIYALKEDAEREREYRQRRAFDDRALVGYVVMDLEPTKQMPAVVIPWTVEKRPVDVDGG